MTLLYMKSLYMKSNKELPELHSDKYMAPKMGDDIIILELHKKLPPPPSDKNMAPKRLMTLLYMKSLYMKSNKELPELHSDKDMVPKWVMTLLY